MISSPFSRLISPLLLREAAKSAEVSCALVHKMVDSARMAFASKGAREHSIVRPIAPDGTIYRYAGGFGAKRIRTPERFRRAHVKPPP